MMNDYRLTIKVRNNRLLKAIEAAGGTPGAKWCALNELDYNRVNDLINMTRSPRLAGGDLSKHAEQLCEVLGKLPDELWSNEQLYPLERNYSEVEMSYAQVAALMPPEQSYLPDFSRLEQEQTKNIVSSVLSTLTQREQDVIRMRFDDGITLKQCGVLLGVTGARVREIESKALRKLKHPSRIGILAEAVDFLSDADRVVLKQNVAYWRERTK